MCLAVPGKILSIAPAAVDAAAMGPVATVDFQGSQIEVAIAMTPDAKEGDWLLVHAGFAIAQLNEEEARETFETLQQALGDEIELPTPD